MVQSLRKIGNSSGIIIPKKLLDRCNITDEVELKLVNDSILIKSAKSKPREGWDQAFKKAIKNYGKEEVIFDGIGNEFDREEW